MDLNIPITKQISECQNILIAGMGGGFDIFCGLPLYLHLRQQGYNVHLANFSFVDVTSLKHGYRLTDTLVGVIGNYKGLTIYFPELYLAQWLFTTLTELIPVWCFHKTGVVPLKENYRALIDHLQIDGIILVDGGVDSLMRGDEAKMGTILEDDVSLNAVNDLTDLPVRLMVSTALGAERDITYAHVFENIATYTQAGAFLGSCSLIKQMPVYQQYEEAVLYAQSQPFQDPSVINSSLISAVRGHYGDYHLTQKTEGSRLWISPLMPIYWFFDLPIIADHKYLLSQLDHTHDIRQALMIYANTASRVPRRPQTKIPLP